MLQHEDNKAYEERFRKDVPQLYEELKSRGNPLIEDGEELENINRKFIVSPASSASVRNTLNTGLQVYDIFCEERLVSGKRSIYDTISQNKLPLFRQTNTLSTPKRKLELLSFKPDCQLYASLYIASQARQADLDDFFAHENHAYPLSLPEYGKLWKTDKSEFLNCLQEIQEPSYNGPQDMKMIVINGVAPSTHEYCEIELGEKLKKVAVPVSQLYLVFDVYREDSLKAETREGRGNVIGVPMKDSTLIYNWRATKNFSGQGRSCGIRALR